MFNEEEDVHWIQTTTKDLLSKKLVVPELQSRKSIIDYLEYLNPDSKKFKKQPKAGESESPYDFINNVCKQSIVKQRVKEAYNKFTPVWLCLYPSGNIEKDFRKCWEAYVITQMY